MKVERLWLLSELQRYWPDRKPYLGDSNYWLPSLREVEDLLLKSWVDQYKWMNEIFDCDDFALIVHAWVVQERYKRRQEEGEKEELKYPWAFGEAWGSKLKGEYTSHAINVVITRDKGIYLAEPQDDHIWAANPDNDILYYIRM